MKAWRNGLGALVPGLALGYVVSRLGFTNYEALHRMLTFQETRLLLAFGLATVLLIGFFVWQGASLWKAKEPITARLVAGAACFGLGWAITGACPGVVFAQIGQGMAPALVSLAGIVLGSWVGGRMASRLG